MINNQSEMKYKDKLRRDRLLSNHNDIRIRNSTSFKLGERMDSMRDKAHRVANDDM